MYQYNGKTLKHYTRKDGLIINGITSMIEDNNGTLWFGSQDGGISSTTTGTDKPVFRLYTRKDGLKDDDYINSALKDSSGGLWFSTFDMGLVRFDGKTFTDF